MKTYFFLTCIFLLFSFCSPPQFNVELEPRNIETEICKKDSASLKISSIDSRAITIHVTGKTDSLFKFMGKDSFNLKPGQINSLKIEFQSPRVGNFTDTISVHGYLTKQRSKKKDTLLVLTGQAKKSYEPNIKSKIEHFHGTVTDIFKSKTTSLSIFNNSDTTLTIAIISKPDSFFTLVGKDTLNVLRGKTKDVGIIFKPTRVGLVMDTITVKRYYQDPVSKMIVKSLPDTNVVLFGEGITQERNKNISNIQSELESLLKELKKILADTISKPDTVIEMKFEQAIKKSFRNLKPEFEEIDKNILSQPDSEFMDVKIFRKSTIDTNYSILNKRHINYGIDVFNLNKFGLNKAFSTGSSKQETYFWEATQYSEQKLPPEIMSAIQRGDTLVLYFNKGFAQIRHNLVFAKRHYDGAVDSLFKLKLSAMDEVEAALINLFSNIDYDFNYGALSKDGNVTGSYLNILDFIAKYFQYMGVNVEIINEFTENLSKSMKSNIHSGIQDLSFHDLMQKCFREAINSTGKNIIEKNLSLLKWYKRLMKEDGTKNKSTSIFNRFIKLYDNIDLLLTLYQFFDDYIRFMYDLYCAQDCAFRISRNMKNAELLFVENNAEYDHNKYSMCPDFLKGNDNVFQQGNMFIFNAHDTCDCSFGKCKAFCGLFENNLIKSDSFKIAFDIYPEEEFDNYLQNKLSQRKDFYYYSGIALVLVDEVSNELYRFEVNYVKDSPSKKNQKQISCEIHSPRDSVQLVEAFGQTKTKITSYNTKINQENIKMNRFRKAITLNSDEINKSIKLEVTGRKNLRNESELTFSYTLNGEKKPFNKFKNSNKIKVTAQKLRKGYTIIHNNKNGRLRAFWKFVETSN